MNGNKIKQAFQKMGKAIIQSGEFRPIFQLDDHAFNPGFILRDGVSLWGHAARTYLEACEEITAIVAGKQTLPPALVGEKTWSPDSVDKAMSECFAPVAHAEIQARGQELQAAASKIVDRFNKKPAVWTVDLLINGMDPDCADLSFGRFHFLAADVDIPQYLRKSLDRSNSLIMARTDAIAIDEQSAVERAKSSLEVHLPILNALCSGRPPSSFELSHVSHVAQTCSIYRVGVLGQEPGNISYNAAITRVPLTRKVFLEIMDERGGHRISGMLSEPSSEFSDRVLSGYVLAGGGCVDPWPERSFLLFAIALESIALGTGNKSEITHQLCTRVAHLVSGNLEGRRDVVKQMNDLYRLRSHIVHEGRAEVSNDELFYIYLYCMAALHVLVLSPAFSEMKTNDDLEKWFSDRVLEAPNHWESEHDPDALNEAQSLQTP